MADVDTIDPTDPNEETAHVQTHPGVYWGSLIGYAVLILGVIIFSSELRYWVLLAAALQIAVSISVQETGYVGGIFAFGMAAVKARSGPNFVLFPFMSHKMIKEYPRQFQFPQDPEYVFHGDDKLPLPIHPDGTPMVRPLRLASGGPRPGYDSILNIQMTTKATGTMRSRIRNFFDFWVRIDGNTTEDKLVELKRQLNDTWFNAVMNEWKNRPIGLCIDESDQIEILVCAKVDKAARTRGIDSYEVTLITPDLTHELSTKLSQIGEASAEGVAIRTLADARAYDTVETAKADAAAHLAKERADVDADVYRVKKMGITGEQMFAADTAARVIGEKDKFFFGAQGLAEGLAAGATIIDSLKSKESKTSKE